MENINDFYDEIVRLLRELQRQYGIANANYTAYALERLENCIITCSTVESLLLRASSGELEDYCVLFNSLIECLRQVYRTWEEYEDLIDSHPDTSLCYHTPLVHMAGNIGRPRFAISRDQLLYLASLSFKWTEIAALLGVSRMTIYRYDVCFVDVWKLLNSRNIPGNTFMSI